LKSGGDEPIYRPCSATNRLAQILSTRDYFSSSLHEVSHWCIAGAERRTLVDFGYWYEPDGRSEMQQKEFERAEVKPQALEWLFTEACGIKFRLSVDNLEYTTSEQGVNGASDWFKLAVLNQVLHYLEFDNLPSRALIFIETLLAHFRPGVKKLEKTAFSMTVLG
jgi:elongation factor P hydroxylase